MGDICERVDHVLANIQAIGAEEAVMTNFGGDLTPGESELLRRTFSTLQNDRNVKQRLLNRVSLCACGTVFFSFVVRKKVVR